MQRPSYQVFNYTLTAGEQVSIHHRANSLVCLAASARFQIAFDDAPLTTFEKGLAYTTPEAFSKVRLLNDSGATITLELGFASGGITDSRLNLPNALDANVINKVRVEIENEAKVKVKVAANVTCKHVSLAAAVTTEIVAFLAARKEVLITNLGDDTVYVGCADVAANSGLPVGSGKTATLACKAELHAYNPAASSCDVSIVELWG